MVKERKPVRGEKIEGGRDKRMIFIFSVFSNFKELFVFSLFIMVLFVSLLGCGGITERKKEEKSFKWGIYSSKGEITEFRQMVAEQKRVDEYGENRVVIQDNVITVMGDDSPVNPNTIVAIKDNRIITARMTKANFAQTPLYPQTEFVGMDFREGDILHGYALKENLRSYELRGIELKGSEVEEILPDVIAFSRKVTYVEEDENSGEIIIWTETAGAEEVFGEIKMSGIAPVPGDMLQEVTQEVQEGEQQEENMLQEITDQVIQEEVGEQGQSQQEGVTQMSPYVGGNLAPVLNYRKKYMLDERGRLKKKIIYSLEEVSELKKLSRINPKWRLNIPVAGIGVLLTLYMPDVLGEFQGGVQALRNLDIRKLADWQVLSLMAFVHYVSYVEFDLDFKLSVKTCVGIIPCGIDGSINKLEAWVGDEVASAIGMSVEKVDKSNFWQRFTEEIANFAVGQIADKVNPYYKVVGGEAILPSKWEYSTTLGNRQFFVSFVPFYVNTSHKLTWDMRLKFYEGSGNLQVGPSFVAGVKRGGSIKDKNIGVQGYLQAPGLDLGVSVGTKGLNIRANTGDAVNQLVFSSFSCPDKGFNPNIKGETFSSVAIGVNFSGLVDNLIDRVFEGFGLARRFLGKVEDLVRNFAKGILEGVGLGEFSLVSLELRIPGGVDLKEKDICPHDIHFIASTDIEGKVSVGSALKKLAQKLGIPTEFRKNLGELLSGTTKSCGKNGCNFDIKLSRLNRNLDSDCCLNRPEICDDGKDNNADGKIDDGCPEKCNGKDDNSDGRIDEGWVRMKIYKDEDGDGFVNEYKFSEVCLPENSNPTALTQYVYYFGKGWEKLPDYNKWKNCGKNGELCLYDCYGGDNNPDLPLVYYKDMDNDGYSDGSYQRSCNYSQPPVGYYRKEHFVYKRWEPWWKANGWDIYAIYGDCNDNDPNVNMAQMEVLADGKDNNCNSLVDEEIELELGKKVMCGWILLKDKIRKKEEVSDAIREGRERNYGIVFKPSDIIFKCWGSNDKNMLGVKISDESKKLDSDCNGDGKKDCSVGGITFGSGFSYPYNPDNSNAFFSFLKNPGDYYFEIGIGDGHVVVSKWSDYFSYRQIASWGNNIYGEVGVRPCGQEPCQQEPAIVISGSRWDIWKIVDIGVGETHTCLVRNIGLRRGVLECWGSNIFGQLGDGTRKSRYERKEVMSDVVKVCGGFSHTCAVKTDGSVWCWGNNEKGQLGIADKNESLNPVKVEISGVPQGMTSVVCGRYHTCALSKTGNIWCWGDNSKGQLGVGNQYGTVVSTPVILNLTEVKQIDSGDYHVCALNRRGELYCWGSNSYGQLGLGASEITGPGCNGGGRPVHLPYYIMRDVYKVMVGGEGTCVQKTNTDILCWGRNDFGQLGLGRVERCVESPAELLRSY